MNLKVTTNLNYRIDDNEIEKFKQKVFSYISEELDTENNITINDISEESIKELLNKYLPDMISEIKENYGSMYSGIICDDYFNTIGFNYNEADVLELVQDISRQLYESEISI